MVLSGLLFGLPLSGGHLVPLPDGVSRGRRPTNGCREAPGALYELYNLLHRLPVPTTAGLPLPIHRVQLHTPLIPTGEDLSVLGLHGSHGAAHELPKLVQINEFNSLFVSDIPLERVLVPYNI